MKRFISSALMVVAAFLTLCAQTTVQGIPWPGAKASAKKGPMRAVSSKSLETQYVRSYIGEGEKTAYLLLQWEKGYCNVVGYHFDGEKTGWDMISDIVAAIPQLYMLTYESELGYVVGGLGFDADGNGKSLIVKSTTGETKRPQPDTNYIQTNGYDFDSWTAIDSRDLWNSGWLTNGYWHYYVADSADGNLTYSPLGASSSKLTDGCVNCWAFSPVNAQDVELKNYEYARISDETNKIGALTYSFVDPWSAPLGIPGITQTAVVTEVGAGVSSVTIADQFKYNSRTLKVVGIAPGGLSAGAALKTVDAGAIDCIGDSALRGCSNLISFKSTATSFFFGDEVFKDCSSLTTLDLPEGWTASYLGEGLFENCTSLTTMPFPKGYTHVPARFLAGSGIVSLTLPEGITSIGDGALATTSLKTLAVFERTPAICTAAAFTGAEDAKLIVPVGCRDIYAQAEGWKVFKNIVETEVGEFVPIGTKFKAGNFWYEVTSNVPDEVVVSYPGPTNPVKYVGNEKNPYSDVASEIFVSGGINGREWQLQIPSAVQYPDKGTFNVVGINDFAFMRVNCPDAKTLSIRTPEGNPHDQIRHIGKYAFTENNASEFIIPANVQTVGEYAFAYMDNLVSLTCENENPDFAEIPAAMCYYDKVLRYCDMLNGNLVKVGDEAFYQHPTDFHVQKELTRLKEVGKNAFSAGYTSATKKVYPILLTDALRKAGDYAFANCKVSVNGTATFTMYADGEYGKSIFDWGTGIEKIVAKEGVKAIPAGTFSNMSDLKTVEFPTTLQTIGAEAFISDSGLSSVTLPEGLKTIGDKAFRSTSLTSINLPASLEVCDGLSFISTLAVINIPEDSKLKSASSFSNTAISTIFIPDGVTVLPAFTRCSSFKGYTGARNVTEIPADAFSYCNIESALIPPTTKIIGDFAWSGCNTLKEIVIPEGVTTLGGRILYNAKNIKDVVVPSTIKSAAGNFQAFDGAPQTANLWICADDYAAIPTNPAHLLINMSTYSRKAFANYYVISGAKTAADKWANGNFTTTEIPLTVSFPENHSIETGLNETSDKASVEIEVIPSVALGQTELTEKEIPASFMALNLRSVIAGENTFIGKYRIAGSSDEWIVFEIEVVAPEESILTRALPAWKYVMKADNLLPDTDYEYMVSLRNQPSDEYRDENIIRSFRTASGISVGIDNIISEMNLTDCRIYDLQGNPRTTLSKGINIVVSSDGKARKVICRK